MILTASLRSCTEVVVFHTSDLLQLLFRLFPREKAEHSFVFLVNQPPQSRGFIKTKILGRYPAVTELGFQTLESVRW